MASGDRYWRQRRVQAEQQLVKARTEMVDVCRRFEGTSTDFQELNRTLGRVRAYREVIKRCDRMLR